MQAQAMDPELMASRLQTIRGDPSVPPEGSIVIPVNAQGDLDNVLRLIANLATYSGKHRVEIVLIVNNYPVNEPPDVEQHRQLGLTVLTIPDVRRQGEVVSFTARIPGIRVAGSDNLLLFDADCKLVNPTATIDWYIDRLNEGYTLAYTHVDFYDVRPYPSVRLQIFIHHLARWVKRVIFRVPIARGSSYAIDRSVLLDAYDKGMLADDMNVGPTVKALGKKIAYTGAKKLRVLTSGRMYEGGWLGMLKYFRYRLRYNLKMLPAGTDATQRTDRHKAPVRKYIGNKLVK
jgi:hypothetical protein